MNIKSPKSSALELLRHTDLDLVLRNSLSSGVEQHTLLTLIHSKCYHTYELQGDKVRSRYAFLIQVNLNKSDKEWHSGTANTRYKGTRTRMKS